MRRSFALGAIFSAICAVGLVSSTSFVAHGAAKKPAAKKPAPAKPAPAPAKAPAPDVKKELEKARQVIKTLLQHAGAELKKANPTVYKQLEQARTTIKAGLAKAGTDLKAAGAAAHKELEKARTAIKKGLEKAGKDLKATGSKLKAALEKAGKDIKKGLDKAGAALKKGVEKIGKDIKEGAKGIIDQFLSLMKELKTFGQNVEKKGLKKALELAFDAIKKKIEDRARFVDGKVKGIFLGFKKVLTMDKFSLNTIGQWGKSAIVSIKDIVSTLGRDIGVPKILGDVLGYIAGGVIAGPLVPAVTPIAAISFGFRQAMKWLIPQLIWGAGSAFSAVGNFLDKLPKGFKDGIQKLLDVAGTGGGLIVALIQDPKAKAQVQAIFEKIADVASKVQGALDKVLKVASSASGVSLLEADAQLSGAGAGAKLDMTKVVGGLIDFLAQQLWLKIQEPLRKVLDKGFGLLEGLLEAPRTAVLAAVGTIPAVGGVLAGALNVGFNILWGAVKENLTTGVLGVVKELLDTIINDVRDGVVATLEKNQAKTQKAGKIVELMNAVAKLAGDISQKMKAASTGIKGTVGIVVARLLERTLLKGMANEEAHQLVAGAIDEAVQAVSKAGPEGLAKGALLSMLRRILKRVASPLAALIAKPIQDAGARGAVQKALSEVLTQLGDGVGLDAIVKGKVDFLKATAMRFVQRLRAAVSTAGAAAAKLPGKLKALTEAIQGGGFAALFQLKYVLGGI